MLDQLDLYCYKSEVADFEQVLLTSEPVAGGLQQQDPAEDHLTDANIRADFRVAVNAFISHGQEEDAQARAEGAETVAADDLPETLRLVFETATRRLRSCLLRSSQNFGGRADAPTQDPESSGDPESVESGAGLQLRATFTQLVAEQRMLFNTLYLVLLSNKALLWKGNKNFGKTVFHRAILTKRLLLDLLDLLCPLWIGRRSCVPLRKLCFLTHEVLVQLKEGMYNFVTEEDGDRGRGGEKVDENVLKGTSRAEMEKQNVEILPDTICPPGIDSNRRNHSGTTTTDTATVESSSGYDFQSFLAVVRHKMRLEDRYCTNDEVPVAVAEALELLEKDIAEFRPLSGTQIAYMLHHGLGLEVEKKISGQKSFCQPTATPSTFDFALDFLQRMELGDVCIFLLRLLLTSCHQSNSTFSAGVDLLEELSLSPDNTPPIEDPEAHRQREVVAFGCGRLLRFLLHAAFCTNTHQPHLHDAFSLFSRTLFDSNGILVLLKYLNQEFSSGTPEQMAGAGIGNEGVGEAPGAGVLGSRSGSSSFFSVGGLLEKRLGSLGIVEEAGKGDAEKRTQEAASIINCNCDEDDADAALASPPRSQHSGRDDTPQNSPKIPPLPEPETPAKLQALTCRDLLDCLYLLSVDQPERVRKILLHYKAPFILKRFAFTEKERYLRLMKLQCRVLPRKWKSQNMPLCSEIYCSPPSPPPQATRSTVPLVDDFLLDQPSSELGDEYDEDEILTTVPFETIRKRHLLMSLGFSVEEEGGPGPCDVFPHVHYKYFVDRGNMEIPWFVQRGSDIQRGEELEKWAVFHSVADIAEAKHKATRNEQFCGENVVNREERFLVGDAGETERESISSGWKEEGGRKLKAEIESDDCLARLLLTPGESPDDEQERWNDDEFEAEAGGLNMEKSPMLDSADFTMLRPPAWLTAKSRNRQQQENEPSAGGDDLQSAIDCEFDNDILAEIEYESGRYARAFPDDALRSVIGIEQAVRAEELVEPEERRLLDDDVLEKRRRQKEMEQFLPERRRGGEFWRMAETEVVRGGSAEDEEDEGDPGDDWEMLGV